MAALAEAIRTAPEQGLETLTSAISRAFMVTQGNRVVVWELIERRGDRDILWHIDAFNGSYLEGQVPENAKLTNRAWAANAAQFNMFMNAQLPRPAPATNAPVAPFG
jgi:hypothetical protein